MSVTKVVRPSITLQVCFLLVLPGVAMAQSGSDDVGQLSVEMRQALDAGDTARAVEIGLKVVALRPEAPGAAYNLACAYARAGDREKGVQWLQASADRGFYYLATMLRDTDLDDIRDQPGYSAAVERMRKNNQAELEKFKTRAGDARVVTVLPPNFDKTQPTPLIVALHGYGSNADDIASTWRNAAAKFGAILIAPEALQRVGSGFSWGVVEQGEYLVMRAIERTQAEYNVDPKRIVLTGFSQGGGMCFTIGLRHPDLLAGVIPVAGFYDHRVDAIPAKSGARLPRFVIMNGAEDEEADNNREAARRLESIGVPVLLRIYEKVGHSFPPNRQPEMERALEFVLKP